MKRTIIEPGFWMMIFGVIILAMLLFAGPANCDDKAVEPNKEVKMIVKKEKVPVPDVKSDGEAVLLIVLIKSLENGDL